MVVLKSEVFDNGDEIMILFLHFLMMTATLFCLSGADESFHCFEDFIHASHVSIHKMFVVNL